MTPRELLRQMEEEGRVEIVIYGLRSKQDHENAIALTKRALSLAAAVDEGSEEVVKRMRALKGCLRNLALEEDCDKAAALLVFQREEIKRKDAEIAGLRQHAEAMAFGWENYNHDDRETFYSMYLVVNAYRTSNHKD